MDGKMLTSPYSMVSDMWSFIKSIFSSGPSLSELLSEDYIVIDVRTPGEFKSGHVQGSKNIPLNQIKSKISSLKKQKKRVILCCASGMRSGRATKILRSEDLDAHNGGSWQTVASAVK